MFESSHGRGRTCRQRAKPTTDTKKQITRRSFENATPSTTHFRCLENEKQERNALRFLPLTPTFVHVAVRFVLVVPKYAVEGEFLNELLRHIDG